MAARIPHSLSYFDPATRRWVAVLSKTIQRPGAQSLVKTKPIKPLFDIVSWNVDFWNNQAHRRCLGLIDHVLERGTPDILCLQEVRSDVRDSLLGNRTIREAFLTTDADVGLACEDDKPFTTMTLLSNKRFAYSLDSKDAVGGSEGGGKFIVGPVSREPLPSASGRDGLYVDIIPPFAPDTFLRIINVHLDSRNRFSYRAQQLKQLARVLREPGCSGGVIVGDFNAVTDEDNKLIEENELEDAWLALHGNTDPDAPTWSVGRRREAEFKPRRLDKVAMVGLTAETMEIMHSGFIDVPKPGGTSDQIEWSDHSGLRCRFAY